MVSKVIVSTMAASAVPRRFEPRKGNRLSNTCPVLLAIEVHEREPFFLDSTTFKSYVKARTSPIHTMPAALLSFTDLTVKGLLSRWLDVDCKEIDHVFTLDSFRKIYVSERDRRNFRGFQLG